MSFPTRTFIWGKYVVEGIPVTQTPAEVMSACDAVAHTEEWLHFTGGGTGHDVFIRGEECVLLEAEPTDEDDEGEFVGEFPHA